LQFELQKQEEQKQEMGNSPPSHSSQNSYAHPSYRPAAQLPGVLTVQPEPIQIASATSNVKAHVETLGNEDALGSLPSGYVRIHGGE
jgi:hypothetical protein